MKRKLTVVLGVLALHAAALWALESGLLPRAAEPVVPAVILLEPMVPPPAKPATPARPATTPTKRPLPVLAAPSTAVSAQPMTMTDPAPTVPGPVGIPGPSDASPQKAPVERLASSPVSALPAAPARLELPSSDADYLQNPKPRYPDQSRRLNEQGTVVLRVLIGTDGTAHQADIKQSSGFERLDQAALATVLQWRYVPGKRAGLPETMWFTLPINFVLE